MADDELTQQKLKRRQTKAAVTRFANSLRRSVAEEEKADVLGTLEKLKSAFKNFESVCLRYGSLLEDENDIDENDNYFDEVQEKYIEILTSTKTWLKSFDAKPEVVDEDKSLLEKTTLGGSDEIFKMLTLPKVEITRFSGDPLKYHTFMAVFDETVDRSSESDKIKLTRLLQYTEGSAHDAISQCILMNSGEGYKQARKLLAERFGNEHIVTDRIINGLVQGKQIRSSESLREFADEISNGYITLKEMKRLTEVESQSFIIKIVDRLQPYLKNRWRRKAMELKEDNDRYPTFDEFVQFVVKEAQEASDPVYGKLNNNVARGGNSSSNVRKSNVLTSNAETKPKFPCVLCKGGHRLFYCKQFRDMRPTQRLQFVTEKKLCENCLLGNHKTVDCRRTEVCTVNGCGQRHTKFIHVNNSARSDSSSNVRLVNANASSSRNVHMPVVGVRVNDNLEACALLDTASSNTFCSRTLIERLGVEGRPISYSLSTLRTNENLESRVVDLELSSLDGTECLSISNVYVVDEIPVTSSCPIFDNFPHLKGLQFVDRGQTVHLLIGQDNADALIPLEVRKGKRGQPFACRTLFGWSVNGPDVFGLPGRKAISHFIRSDSTSEVCQLSEFENGDLDLESLSLSHNDKRVLELWDRETCFADGHYQVPIPWKDSVEVPNNLFVAKSRLVSLKQSLEKKSLMHSYDAEISKLLRCGYAEPVPKEEADGVDRIWYLPHQAVISDKKPGKLRVVFDCASRFRGESLNDKCFQGPDLNNKLLHVLLRFRQHEFCFMADIESMFYQVRIPLKDRNALRFLWYDSEGNMVQYRMTCHVFGGVWCPSSTTYALRKILTDNPDADELVQDTILRNFYVDDCLSSFESMEDAVKVMLGTRDLLFQCGFRLTKFVVNDPRLQSHIPSEDRAEEVKDVQMAETCNKVLGIRWNARNDELYFFVNFDSDITRRSMLKFIASIYDPLGLVNPMVVMGKILLQEATRRKLGWDDSVPVDLGSRWLKWIEGLPKIASLRIARCIRPGSFSDAVTELHHFSDASEQAYGACSYIRCINKDGLIHTALLLSRCRVAPIKTCTIPRLELQAAVVAVKLDALLRKQLDFSGMVSYFWVDSEIALRYIQNEDRRFHVFVANRVGVIRQLSEPSQWNHISGCDNPADIITRGQYVDSVDYQKWYDGPDFLRTYKHDWNVQLVDPVLSDSDPEVKREVKSNVMSVNCDDATDRLLAYFSDWSKLRRAVGWFLKYKQFLKNKIGISKGLSVADVKAAEIAIVRYVQHKCFEKELKSLCNGKNVSKTSSIKGLSPFVDECGVIRVGGRLANSSFRRDFKNPYLIPHSHTIARVIAREFHNIAHLGTEWVTSLIRRTFWITKVRNLVKSISRDCLKCKRLFASPMNQLMADLPSERVEAGKPPFIDIGLDCFGPFLIRQGRSHVKRYGCIFTCLSSRAIHLEVLSGMDTDNFINGLRRFMARRGQPLTIRCDNGTNFVGGKSELSKSMKSLDVQRIENYHLVKGIEWKFNPPYASHMGGVWERLIRTVKRVLLGLLVENISTRMTDEMFQTLMCEVESIVNGRPLTKVSDDVKDCSALTPNHLLILRGYVPFPPGKFDESELFRRKWRCVQHLANQFWSRWIREYVPELQRRCKWLNKQRNFQVGDLVLLCEESTPRGVWPLGIVTAVNPSSDGFIRSVTVKTKCSTFVRPITKIVFLECFN